MNDVRTQDVGQPEFQEVLDCLRMQLQDFEENNARLYSKVDNIKRDTNLKEPGSEGEKRSPEADIMESLRRINERLSFHNRTFRELNDRLSKLI